MNTDDIVNNIKYSMGKKLLEVAHEVASDLYEVGAIDVIAMREYEALCFSPVCENK